MSVTTDLRCPKCQAPMRVIERNGVTVERCTECGGIFLDRGELERLIRAEGEYNVRYEQSTRGREHEFERDDDDDYERGYHHQARPPKKKRRGFLEDIFDFG